MMSFSLKIHQISKKSLFIVSAAILGTISLTSCSQPRSRMTTVESSPVAQEVSKKTESPTLKNLQAAYNGESNAHAMYLAFAQKADQEGYKEVATLFRAAARAEEIHRDNHAKVIREMGATPQSNVTTPEVKSTKENLETAIKGESYERETMYPDFIKQAKADGNKAAVQTFTYAQKAEGEHAQLYTQAKNNLAAWRQAKNPFYVCKISGETFINQNEASSNCPQKQFEKVS